MSDWLGLSRAGTVLGLHINDRHLSAVAVRSDPLRLVSVGRHPVSDASVIGGDIRLVGSLGDELAAMVERLRLPATSITIAAVEPAEPTITAFDDQETGRCNVRRQSHDRLVSAVQRSGLRLQALDAVPIGLARLGRLATTDLVALRGGFGWAVLTGPDYTEAERTTAAEGHRLCIGSDLNSIRPLTIDDLPIEVPRALRRAVDLDRDAVALGAALAGFDLGPTMDIRPVTEPVDERWTAQPVDEIVLQPLRRSEETRRKRSHPPAGAAASRKAPIR